MRNPKETRAEGFAKEGKTDVTAAALNRPIFDAVNDRMNAAMGGTALTYDQASTRRMSTKEEIEQKIKYYQDKIEKLWSLKIRLDESRCEDILNSIKTEFDYL